MYVCRYVGTSSNPNKKMNDNQNYHFAYKIRIQSLRYPIPKDETKVVQLLGRTWYIQEEEEEEEPFLSTNNDNDDNDTIKLYKDVVSIDAPTTGAGKKFYTTNFFWFHSSTTSISTIQCMESF